MAKVSIILPSYNRAHTIERAINSILIQDYDDYEVLIVDNGSTDATRTIIDGIHDPRIRYLFFDDKSGPGPARNHGLSRAMGEFVAFIDSDDEWLPGKLRQQVEILEANRGKIGLVYSDMWWIPLDQARSYHQSPTMVPGDMINDGTGFYKVFLLGIQSALVVRSCFDEVGVFREDLKCFEDLELLLRLERKFAFSHIQRPLVNYYETRGSVSSQQNVELQVRARLLSIYRDELRKNRAFYLRESIILTCFENTRLGGYFSKGNRLSFFQWLKSENSPYMRSFQVFWIRSTRVVFRNALLRFWDRFSRQDAVAPADVVVTLAPPNNNRLEKSFALYDSSVSDNILMFTNSAEDVYSGRTNEPNRQRVEALHKEGALTFISPGGVARPSTLSEIETLSGVLKPGQQTIVVTDAFHTRRVRMIVDKVFGQGADSIRIVAAENPRLDRDRWWHSLSGIRTFRTEFIKQFYYRHYLLRR